MADDKSQTEYSQTDVTSGLNESLGNGFKITGKVMKKSLVNTEKKIDKAESKLEKTNQNLKEENFKYSMNYGVEKHLGHRISTGFDAEKQSRLTELKHIQKKRKLTGSEATELIGLEREKAKARAGAKAHKSKLATIEAKGKLPEYDLKTGFYGDKKIDLSDVTKKRQRLQVLREAKANGVLTAWQVDELKNLEKTIGKADKKTEIQKKRNKNNAVKALGKQAEAFTDSVVKGDGENLGTEAFLDGKNTVKGTYDFLTETTHGIKDSIELHKTRKDIKTRRKAYRKALKKEKQQFNAEVDYLYKDFLEDYDKKEALKPEKDRKELTNKQKAAQKRQIKKQYAAELREKEGLAPGSKKYKERIREKIAKKKKEAEEAIKKALFKYITAFLIVFALFAVIIIFIAAGSTTSVVAEASYNTNRTDIEQSEEYITQLELDLEDTINNIETDNPGYDEYNYQIDEIGHNAYDLSNYLAAKNASDGYLFEGSEPDLDSLFDEMYELSTVSRNETRSTTGTCSCAKPPSATSCDASCSCRAEDGTCHCTDTIYYTVTILDVTLKRKEINDIASDSFTEQQMGCYELYQKSGGYIQIFSSPLEMDWLNAIGRNYGSSKNPSTDTVEDHKGIDINVDADMDVYSAVFKGTVEETGTDSAFGNYVSIKKDSGEVIKFAHLSSIYVAVGDEVGIKTIIGKTGKTGSECYGKYQLHIETYDKDGTCVNPVYAINTRFGTLSESLEQGEDNLPGSYYNSSTGGSTREEVNLPETYPSGDVEDLISFAEQFCGMEYVWGGSNPTTGFDCSGFVSYCVRESGFYPSMQRKTAQGIYDNYCTPISAEEAQAGDLIFFQGTYNTGDSRVITHIGIYCGNGIMLHCGDPIKYASTKTKYWTQHFYGYGRVGQ